MSSEEPRGRVVYFSFLPTSLLTFLLLIATHTHGDVPTGNEINYPDVLALHPVGYWPADEGHGGTLNDRSGNNNHGRLIHVPWDKGLLDFTGAYQWAEIPASTKYQSKSLTVGGWVFIRSKVEGSDASSRMGMLLIGNKGAKNTGSVQICVRRQEKIDVVSKGKSDVFGTWGEGKPSLSLGEWHHLLFTFEATSGKEASDLHGKGSLYLDGHLLATNEDILYKSENQSIQIGNDAHWWHQMRWKSGSLDGSVRHMVWFDRALSAEEAARLHKVTKPSIQPKFYGEDMVVLKGRGMAAGHLKDLPALQRRAALQLFGNKDAATLQPLSNSLLPVLIADLQVADCRLPAAQLLIKLNSDPARAALRAAVPQMVAVVQAADKAQVERAEAALALAAMKQDASSASTALAQTLKELLKQEGERLPRVEDLLRNALIRALLDISPSDPQARDILGLALAKPVFALMGLTGTRFDAVRRLVDEHRTMDALAAFTKLPPGENFFSSRDSGKRDYTSIIRDKGVTYKVGSGIAWQGGEQVSKDDYEKIIGKLTGKYPQAKDWRPSDFPNLYRIPITKINPDGTQQKAYLGGDDFVLDGSDAKMLGWSLFLDEAGYIHLTGGQHNLPNPDSYIPGSWEEMGGSRDRNHADFPAQMYWVTKETGNIETFEFVGRKSDPRAIPASYLNYMVFLQSPANNTYLYGRAIACGWQSWGMFRYDAETKRWATVGGDPFDLIESARRHDANWLNYLHDHVRGYVPKAPTADRPLVWAWQPDFYNFCRDDWGAKFDKTGRLHVKMGIEGLDGAGYVRFSSVYAYSDDNAKTFHRADGSPVALPLTINPAPDHNADLLNGQWWNLWLSLMGYAGLK